MWKSTDSSIRQAGVGNVFLKNLDNAIDDKDFNHRFSAFGKILSSTIERDENGVSKGYGFIHYENEVDATNAIMKVNGMLLNGKKIFPSKYVPRNQRRKELEENAKAHLFVNNFGEEMNNEKLFELFSQYGTITFHKVVYSKEGKNMGFGFVNYEKEAHAQLAIENLHEKKFNGARLNVRRAQTKEERKAQLEKRLAKDRFEGAVDRQGGNLFIKNFEDAIDEERLRKEFADYGDITCVEIFSYIKKRDSSFGFIYFKLPNEATRAVTEMNGRILLTKPLHVALVCKTVRLASRYMDKAAKLRMKNDPLVFDTPTHYPPILPSVLGNTPGDINSRMPQPGNIRGTSCIEVG